MNVKNFILCGGALSALMLSTGWLDGNFTKRTQIDVDAFRHPAGKNVMLTIDPARLKKAVGVDFAPGKVKLGFTSLSGKESELAFAS